MIRIIADSERLAIVNSELNLAHNKPMKYPDYARRFRLLCAEADAPKVQKELAKWLGYSQATISDWLNGEKLPSMDTALKLAEKFDCCVEYLLTGKGDKYKTVQKNNSFPVHNIDSKKIKRGDINNVEEIDAKRGKVPLIGWTQAGAWAEAVDLYEVGDAEAWYDCPVPHGKRTFILKVINDSMTSPYPGQKSYPEGTMIFVDPDKEVVNGSKVIAKILDSNETTFKVYREDGGQRWLFPLNPAYDKIQIVDGMSIVGVLIGSFMPE